MAPDTTSLQDLPPELLLEIFSYLLPGDLILGVGRVCQKFHELSLNHTLWRHIKVSCLKKKASISGSSESAENFYWKMVNQRCTREINLAIDTLLVKDVATVVEERGPVWPSCSVTRDVVYPKLQQLVLVRDTLPSMHFLQHYKGLTHLHVEEECEEKEETTGPFFQRKVLDIFENLKGMEKLQTLKLMFSLYFSFKGHDTVTATQKSMVEYFVSGPRLREIDISMDIVNDDIFRTILDHCLELEDLSLGSPDFTEKGFMAVLSQKQWPLLTSLRITDCETLNDHCLRALPLAFPNLKCLKLSLTQTMTDDGVGELLRKCSQLKSLSLSILLSPILGIRKVTGCCLKELAYHGNLHSLHLQNFDLTYRYDEWDFEKLCQHQQNLHTIELSLCDVNDHMILSMADNCPLLQTVEMILCTGLNSRQQAILIKRLPHLQTLHWDDSLGQTLSGAELFSVEERRPSSEVMLLNQPAEQHSSSLRSLTLNTSEERMAGERSALISLFSNLLHLDVRTSAILSDDTVANILGSCPRLRHLSVPPDLWMEQRDASLTDASLKHIGALGHRLQTVQLMTFRSFTSAALARTLVNCPALRQCSVVCADSSNMHRAMITEVKTVLKERDHTALCYSVEMNIYQVFPDLTGRLMGLDILIHSRMDCGTDFSNTSNNSHVCLPQV